MEERERPRYSPAKHDPISWMTPQSSHPSLKHQQGKEYFVVEDGLSIGRALGEHDG